MKFVYEPEAPDVINRLWEETMEELSFARVTDILDSVNN